ncbi:MAG: TIGR01620 family protein [Rhodobacteraceae bacterium]|nr:TIGR01620 family protein [Paracoccaceae bacterium]
MNEKKTGQRRPAAFASTDTRVKISLPDPDLSLVDPSLPVGLDEITAQAGKPDKKTKSGFSFFKWIGIGIGGLVSLAFGLAIDSLIQDLFARQTWLGWVAVGLTVIAVTSLVGLIIKEYVGILRIAKMEHLREALTKAAADNDAKAARQNLDKLVALYSSVPETARGRQRLGEHMNEVIDGRDLIVLAERDLMRTLDRQAQQVVLASAKRVSLVTAVSPRALVDLLAVLFENLRTIRKLSTLYGGRPGTLGFIRLTKHIVTHLAITGGMAAGESFASQVLGHGLAARLSARLGEGLLNGVLTARIGIAAIAVCRPAPFIDTKGPRLSDFAGELIKTTEKAEDIKD